MPDWPAAILFDFDGIVVNSEPLHFQAFKEALAEDGIALSEREYYAELIGFDDRGAIRHVLSKHDRAVDESAFARLLAGKSRRMRQIIRDGLISALPGVVEFVRGLRDYPLAICSGALRAEIEMMLDGIGLRENFPLIVAAEDVTIGKPDPSGYLQSIRLLARRTGKPIAPADALVIEDAPTVIESVRQAGFKVLGVATTYPPQELASAHYVVRSLRPAEVLAKIPELRIRSTA
jgi:HAD superfamily hydrolase (TIGR01509 family)